MVPKGMCVEAFHNIYPYALGLLYNINQDKFKVRCPKGNIVFEIRREQQDLIHKAKYHLKSLIDPIYPVDPRNHRIFIKVAKLEGECLNNHKIGQEYEFNQDKQTELCPAAFDSIYPFICAGGNPLCCQDHLTNVAFGLQNQNHTKIPLPCQDKKVKITIKKVNGECPYGLKENQEYSFQDTFPIGMCDSFFHNIYPYMFAFERGGNFKYNKQKNIIVQCPNPKGRVAMNVIWENDTTYLEFVQVKGVCPKGIPKNIILPVQLSFCPKLFDAIFPYVIALDGKTEVSCPNYPNNVVVELEKQSEVV